MDGTVHGELRPWSAQRPRIYDVFIRANNILRDKGHEPGRFAPTVLTVDGAPYKAQFTCCKKCGMKAYLKGDFDLIGQAVEMDCDGQWRARTRGLIK